MLLRWAVNHPSVAGAGLRIETSLLERNTPTRRTGPTPLIPPPARQSSAEPRNIPLGDTDPELASEIARRVGRLVLHRENSNGSFNRRVREKTGIPELSHHRLLHTFATRWLERGGSIVALESVLGHSDLMLTQRYARATKEFIRSEARKVAAAARNGDETKTAGAAKGQVIGIKQGTMSS